MAATAGEQELVITRTFDAPRQKVWRAWTEPEQVKRWWGPREFTMPVCNIDLREGGQYFGCMRSPTGEKFWNTGTYQEIVAPERLVMTDSFADEQGYIVPATHYGMSEDFPIELQVVVLFEETPDGKTNMTLRHIGMPAGDLLDQARTGWNESFDKLAGVLAIT